MINVIDKLMDQIKIHEGLSLKMYKCPSGYHTIGYGFNLDANEISLSMAEELLEIKAKEALELGFLIIHNWADLSVNRQLVIADMIYNLGKRGFLQFKKFIAAIESYDFDWAADEMLDSKWAIQVKERARKLADQMRKG